MLLYSAAVKRIPARERAEAVWLWAQESGAGADVPPQRRPWLADLNPPSADRTPWAGRNILGQGTWTMILIDAKPLTRPIMINAVFLAIPTPTHSLSPRQ